MDKHTKKGVCDKCQKRTVVRTIPDWQPKGEKPVFYCVNCYQKETQNWLKHAKAFLENVKKDPEYANWVKHKLDNTD